MRLVEWFYPKKLSKTKKIIFDLCRGCGPTSLTAEAEDFMAFKNTSQFCLRWWILSFSMSFPHIFESAFTSLCQFWPKFLTFRSIKHVILARTKLKVFFVNFKETIELEMPICFYVLLKLGFLNYRQLQHFIFPISFFFRKFN